MEKTTSYGRFTMSLVIISVSVVLLGIFWLFVGIADDISRLAFQGTLTMILGIGIGAVANYL